MSRQSERNSVDTHIKNIWVILGYLSLGFAWLVLVVFGIGLAISDKTHPILGWTALVLALAIAFATVPKWLKALPGIFGVGALNCLFAMQSGHFGAHSSKPISPLSAGAMAVLMMGSAALSTRLKLREVTMFARTALSGVVFFFIAGAADQRLVIPSLSLAFACLGAVVGKRYFDKAKRPLPR